MLDATVKIGVPVSLPTTRQNILTLLDKLPLENLLMVETFVRFVRDQQHTISTSFTNDQAQWRYPTIPTTTVNLDNLIGIMQDVGGDALADTESMYDEG